MRRCLALWSVLVVSAAQAAPFSVLDARLNFDLRDTPFSEVLATLSRQSGYSVVSPIAALRPGPGLPGAANLAEEHRRRLDPSISLSAKDETLRQVLRRLVAMGCSLQLNGQQIQVMGLPGTRQTEPPPEVRAGAYRVQLHGVTSENVDTRRFGQPASARRQTRVELGIGGDTELAGRALMGYATDYHLTMDGEELLAQPPQTQQGWLPLPGASLAGRCDLVFGLAVKPLQAIDRLTGSLRVYSDAKEVALEFGDLDKGGQQQTDGDIDVTLVSFAPAAEGFTVAGQPRQAQARLTVSYPKTEVNEQLLRSLHRPMRGIGVPDGAIQMPPPPAMLGLAPGVQGGAMPQVQRQVQGNVTIMRNGQVQRFEMDPNCEFRQVEGIQGGLPGGLATAFVPMSPFGGASGGLAPMVAMETATGRFAMTLGQTQAATEGDDRIVLTCTALGPLPAEPVQRLLVGLVDFGEKVGSVGYAFTGVELPPAAER